MIWDATLRDQFRSSGGGLPEAKASYDRLRVERDDDRLRPLGLTPKLSDYYKIPTRNS